MREREEIQYNSQFPVNARHVGAIDQGRKQWFLQRVASINSDFQLEVGHVLLGVAGELGCLGREPAPIIGI